MSTTIVDRIYLQSLNAEFALEPPVVVFNLDRDHSKSLGTVGEVLGSACIQHIIEAHIVTLDENGDKVPGVYGEKLRDMADRFDSEIEERTHSDPGSIRGVLEAAFGAQDITLTEVPFEVATMSPGRPVSDEIPAPVRHLQLVA